MTLPEWLTARTEDGQIYGCKEGTIAHIHELGHLKYKSDDSMYVFRMGAQMFQIACFVTFIMTGWLLPLQFGISIILSDMFTEEAYAWWYAWKHRKEH